MKTERKREQNGKERTRILFLCMFEAERKHGLLAPGKKTYPVSELQKMVRVVLVISPSYHQKRALEIKQRTN